MNLLLHTVNALLLWRLLKRLGVPGAWLGAALFALHPVQVESVAWVSELKNVLMLFFYLPAVLAWVEFIERPAKQGWKYYLLALFLYALALCAKTTACTLPVTLLLILWLKAKPIGRVRVAQTLPFFAFGLGMGLLAMWWERYHQGTEGARFAIPWLERILIAGHAFWFYLGKLVWPAHLTFVYPRWPIDDAASAARYLWLAAAAAFGGVIYFTRRFFGRAVETALIFFAVTLSPVMGLIMEYTFRYTFVADHYQYVACIGPMALASAGLSLACGTLGRRAALAKTILSGAWLLTLGVLTWRQCGMYANAETLWRTTLARNPDCQMAYINLGKTLDEQGDVEQAMAQFQKALQINPNFVEAHNDLGIMLFEKGRVDEAIAQYQKALQSDPDNAETRNNLGFALFQKGRVDEAIVQYQATLEINPHLAQVHDNLGNALFKKGEVDEAIAQFQKALQSDPDNADARNNLGFALFQKGRVDEAIVQYRETLEINPHLAQVHDRLGSALLIKGKVDEAIAQYQAALQINPRYVQTLNNLAWVLATFPRASVRNGQQAVELAQRANQLAGDGHLALLGTLAAAYAEAGRFPEAVSTAQRALQMAQMQTNTARADALRSQLKLYQAGSPFRDTEQKP